MMKFPRLALVALCLANPHAQAAELRLAPLEIINYVGQNLRVSLEIGCGGSFYGILAQMQPGRKLKLAAVIEQANVNCTSVPDRRVVDLDFVDSTTTKEIGALSISPRLQRISLGQVHDVVLPRQAQGSMVAPVITHQSSCDPIIGTIMRPVGPGQYELGLALHRGREERPSCAKVGTEVSRVEGFRIPVQSKAWGLRRAPRHSNLHRDYELRLAPIAEGGLQIVHGAGLSLRYKRECNQAPVGIVQDGQGRRFGVLVAHYWNRTCLPHEATTWNTIADPDILPQTTPLAMAPGSTGLKLITPRDLKRPRGDKVKVRFAAACDRHLGSVITKDSQGRPSIAILAMTSASRCNSAPREVSWQLANIGRHVESRDLVPLRLGGPSRG